MEPSCLRDQIKSDLAADNHHHPLRAGTTGYPMTALTIRAELADAACRAGTAGPQHTVPPAVPQPRRAQDQTEQPRTASCRPGSERRESLSARLYRCLRSMEASLPALHIPQHDSLYNWGEPGDQLYIVESGYLKTMTYSPLGKSCLLDIYTPGDIVGESCLFSSVRTETATAMLPVTCRKVRREHLLESMADNGLREELIRHLAGRILEQQRTISLFVTVDSERRLGATLLRLGRKLGVRQGDLLHISHRITHEELGDLVGTTRSRIGYFLKRFRDLGLIDARRPRSLAVHEHRMAEYTEDTDA
ncbi:CRP-like cAMP-binding protein [Saccharothrix tamanrassetensis]|uniref:CRP-like cAMP-binding protein n=1 Tax=Saccharothrix tamanrassetensis TaxID=1051531 RepID=A0A841CC83_9PSEU|nr:Crp/Fnr family transcriptional regulator [Saccharothrix tamanrassetensis]MBB5953787.1 CRP-like cAMP-binding protein [Saccharothrix tamanrassetensis]